MKWITYSLLIILCSFKSYSAHFTSVYDSNAPFYMNINVLEATLNGTNLQAGDEIAVFDGSICCYSITLSQPINPSNSSTFGILIPSKSYETPINGYTVGHSITYKFWDSSALSEISGITAQYYDNLNNPISAQTFTDDGSAFVKLSFSIPNVAPVSNAGSNQSVTEGALVTLDGTASSDADSNPLTYSWTAPSGITLSSTTAAKPTFTAPEVAADQTFTFSLVVNDGITNSSADQVVITVLNCTPATPTVGTITQPSCLVATGSVVLSGLPSTGTWTLTRSPGGTTTTGSGTSTTISSLAAGTYTFTVTNASGCTSTASANVVINAQPTTPTAPSVGTITQPTCAVATGSVVLSGLPASGTWTLTRSPGGITTTGTGTSTTVSLIPAGTYTYTVTNASGCVSASTSNVVINAQAETPATPTIGTITQPTCSVATGSVVLSGLPASGTWTTTRSPGGTTTTGTGTSTTISSLAAGTYTFTITNASGCVSAASANVVINAQPATPSAPTVGTITQPTCSVATGSVVLSGLPSSGTWTLTRSPGGATTTGTGTSSTISSLAAGTYTFTVANASGCVSASSANVVINTQPTTPTAPTVGTITQPTCAVATGSVVLSGLPASGTWTLTRSPGGTTTTGTGTSTTISSLAAGTYTFTVTNASGCISAASANVVINAQPTTPTAPTVGTITHPTCSLATGSVILSGLPASGTWSITQSPGGTTTSGTGTNTTISSLATGTYTFTVTNASGCASASSANVVINAQPTTPTAPVVGTITQPTCAVATGSVVLSGLPSSGTWTLTKSPGGTATTGTGTSTTISLLAPGTYTFTVTNSSGCSSASSANVVISAQPNAPAAPTVGAITQPTCSGATGSVVLSGLPSSGTWTLTRSPGGNTTTGTGASTTLSSLSAGTYTFTVTDASGCISASSANAVINAQPATPTAPVVGTITQPTCAVATGSVVLSGLPSSGTWTLTRSPGGTTTSGTGTSTTITSLAANTYSFTVTNSSGCISASSANVVINAQPATPSAPTIGTITQPTTSVSTGSIALSGLPSSGTWTLTRYPGGNTTTGSGTTTTVSALTPGTYYFTVTNSSGCISASSANAFLNAIPISNAGADQSVNEGTLVTLDGSASSDTDNQTLSYNWLAPAGITLSSTTVAKPTFTAPEVQSNQNYTFTLTVNDGYTNSVSDQIVVNVKQVNKTPVANAGADQSVNEGVLVTLDGSASSDQDNNTLTYLWTAPAGITLSSTTAAKPTFTAPEVQTNQNYTFALIVNDGTVNSTADQVVITVKQVNKAPVANAGADQSVNEGTLVTLDGSASSDQDNNTLTYLWTAPAGITLSSVTAAKPTFTGPEVQSNQNYTFSLTVNDGTVNSTADQVIITVKQVNKAPIANAGTDQSLNEGTLVTLDGSASSDADNNTLTYLWTAPAGIPLSSATAAKPTFTAPEVQTNQNYIFTLTVNDGIASSTADQVTITVIQVNKAPTANAGADQSVAQNILYTLDGSGSTDPDGDNLSYSWTAPSGITLSSASVAKPTFTTPSVAPGTSYTFSLTVNDGKVSSQTDQVVITIKQVNQTPTANAGTDQTVNEGTRVTLNGSASSDADGDALVYHWTAPAGITLNTTIPSKPIFTAPEISSDQLYTFSLTVNDGTVDSSPDQIVVTVKQVNKAPTANAGADQIVNEGVQVTLDGSASSDPDNNTLIYSWAAPFGITLNSANTARPIFTAPTVSTDQNYTFSLTVSDGSLISTTDQVIIRVQHINISPTASAGVDQTVNEGALVTLDGTPSSDPEKSSLSYLWTAPSSITLSSNTAAKPSFTAPEVMTDQNFTFSLVVNDGTLSSAADQVTVIVKQVNKAPTANAGADQSVIEGSLVTLDGSASTDPDRNSLSYVWTPPAGITLNSNSVAKPTFTAPEVASDKTYAFKLVVNDGALFSNTSQVFITVRQENKAPVLTSSTAITATEDLHMEYLFSASDAENDPVNFTIGNLPSFLSLTKKSNNTSLLSGTFTNEYVGENKFKLTLSDGITTKEETITINVINTDDTPYVKDSIDNISVDKGAPDVVVDLTLVFADDDKTDQLSYTLLSNSDSQIVTPQVIGSKLVISFSKEKDGKAEVIITASSNGKTAESKFKVEVKIPTGIELPKNDANILVYPNPTDGVVYIKLPQPVYGGTVISVYNETGRLIVNKMANSNEEQVDLGNLVPGIYFIKIGAENAKTVKIILK